MSNSNYKPSLSCDTITAKTRLVLPLWQTETPIFKRHKTSGKYNKYLAKDSTSLTSFHSSIFNLPSSEIVPKLSLLIIMQNRCFKLQIRSSIMNFYAIQRFCIWCFYHKKYINSIKLVDNFKREASDRESK